ncbi:MAG: hypothetical protein DRH32_10110 [Deltaproteobacteria bacterium]|nr:MAG: hypothetical protein DRH32_10110 [Deltaproteobacteria bacterium]
MTHRLKKDGFSDAKAKLEDGNESIEVMIPSKIYQKTRPILLPGTPVIVEGYCELDEFRIGPLQADRIMPLTDTDISKPSPRRRQGLPDNLPCPFCGRFQIWMRTEIEPPHNLNESTDMVIACQIQCAHCQALGPAGTIEMTADNLAVETAAIGQWNRRYCLKEEPGKKLKACPFCGHHPPKIGYFLDPDPPEVIETGVISNITCPKCGASVSMHTCDSCLTIWDSRVLYGGSCTC